MAQSPFDLERLAQTLASLFAYEGLPAEVALLAYSAVRLEETGYDNWNGGTTTYAFHLDVPVHIFSQVAVAGRQAEVEESILSKLKLLTRDRPNDLITSVVVAPLVPVERTEGWRDKAKAWLAGSGVTNQGRVRSDNVAPRNCDGLLFRSQAEIHLYRAFKGLGVPVAPLPVFVQGGPEYHRLEPDFVLIRDGIVMVVEVDGDTVHLETPAEAHARTSVLAHAGAYIERVPASKCETPERARQCAEDLLEIMARHKANR